MRILVWEGKEYDFEEMELIFKGGIRFEGELRFVRG